MAFTGAHVIVYSKDADKDREFIRDVLGFPHVDVGHGWLIFALPPAEIAAHPSDEEKHELYLMCDDVKSVIASMRAKNVECSDVHEERWGSLVSVSLPGGGKLGIYQPKHASPTWSPGTKRAAKAAPKAKAKAQSKAKPKATPKKKSAPKANPRQRPRASADRTRAISRT
jgi:hypothetical protein